MSQRTFSIIKPDAVRKGYTAAILAEIEKAGFKIVAIKRMSISNAQAEGFYHVHSARPFFGSLTQFMSGGPIFPMVLEKENAIADLRKLMGADQSCERGRRYHPKAICGFHRRERDPRLRCRGHCRLRDRLLLRRLRAGLASDAFPVDRCLQMLAMDTWERITVDNKSTSP